MKKVAAGVQVYSWRVRGRRAAQAMLQTFKEPMAGGSTLITIAGTIYTERGIVTVQAARSEPPNDDADHGHTVYRLIRGGRYYVFSEYRWRSGQSLIRMAARLIRGQVRVGPENLE